MIVERSPNTSCFKIKVVVHFLKKDCISVSNFPLASILKNHIYQTRSIPTILLKYRELWAVYLGDKDQQ